MCEGEAMKCGEYTHSHKFTMYLETSKVGLCLPQSVVVCFHWNQLLCPPNPVLKVGDLLGCTDPANSPGKPFACEEGRECVRR